MGEQAEMLALQRRCASLEEERKALLTQCTSKDKQIEHQAAGECSYISGVVVDNGSG